METLIRKWEQENLEWAWTNLRLIALLLLRTASFGLFVLYYAAKGLFLLAMMLLRAPRLVQEVGPGKRPLERHEFERISNEFRIPRS
jgi:hypothetical protein